MFQENEKSARSIDYNFSKGLPERLTHFVVSLMLTTYQAGKLMVIRAGGNGTLSTLFRNFERPIWLLIPVLLVSIAISAFLYCRSKEDFPPYLRIILFSMRFLLLFGLGILLLNPYFFNESKVLLNLYDRQLQNIQKALNYLDEDLQFDYQAELEAIYKPLH